MNSANKRASVDVLWARTKRSTCTYSSSAPRRHRQRHPDDVYYGRRDEIVQCRKEVSRRRLQQHGGYHRASRERETGRKSQSADDIRGLATTLRTR